MKFRYDINDNYFEVFNESQGIVTFRNEIEKDPYKVDTYIGKCISYGKIVAILLVITLILNTINSEWFFSEVSLFLFAIITAFLVALLVVFFTSYFQQKKMFHSGEIKFDKNGILDVSDSGIKIGIDWSLVDLVVVKDKVIVLLTKSNFYFHFDEELIDDVLKAINKYHSGVKILDVSLTRYNNEELVKFKKIDEIKLNEVKEEIKEENKEEQEEKEEEKSIDKLNPITEEVVDMDKDTIKEIIIPPYDESEELNDED